jgi:hypothetical protein
MWAIAVIYIWTAFLVKRGSRGAAITSLVVAIINVVGMLAIVCMGTIGILSGGGDPGSLVSVLFYLLPAAANGWLIFALVSLLRERRGTTS